MKMREPAFMDAEPVERPRGILRMVATPLTAALIAMLLLAGGFFYVVRNEQISRAEKIRQTEVQAQILASGIAAPLAFDDDPALQEYLNALRANPQILSAGAYGNDGNLAAGYALPGNSLPATVGVGPPRITDSVLTVTTPVIQGSSQLGTVYLHTALESLPRRAMRYVGIALIIMLASLLIVVLGTSYASLRDAHAKLQAEIVSRQNAEEALRQAQKMEALGQLTGGVAHDFNNLLMVAAGGLDLMERTNDPAKVERLKTGIRQAVDRGAKLTQQLLAFSRRSPLHPEVIDLGTRIRGMDTLLDRSLGEDITVAMSFPPGVWPVEVDASELEVAVLNIVLNARDAMPKGGTITIEAQNIAMGAEAQENVILSITDMGVGMEPETVAKIFEPFFTTKGVGRGTGLGLSQVYGFARASGGEVHVNSTVGKGTTISLLLPRSHRYPVEKIETVAPVVTASAANRILLVEDDDNVAGMVGEMLRELGYDVERAVNVDAALERLQQGTNFELVFSDMVMPGEKGGMDLYRAVTRTWPYLPVMLTTGYSTAAATALNEGVRLLMKPYAIQDLAAHIDAAIAAGAAHKEQ